MATRSNTQIDALYKDTAFIFPGSEAVSNNSEKVLIDHELEMFEVGKLRTCSHMVFNVC